MQQPPISEIFYAGVNLELGKPVVVLNTSDLVDYARYAGRTSYVVVCVALKEGTPVKVCRTHTSLTEVVTTITEAKSAKSAPTEQERWAAEAEYLLG